MTDRPYQPGFIPRGALIHAIEEAGFSPSDAQRVVDVVEGVLGGLGSDGADGGGVSDVEDVA